MKKAGMILIVLSLFLITLVQAVEFDKSLESVSDNEVVKVSIAISENTQSGLFRAQSSVDRNETLSELSDNYQVEYVAQTFNSVTLEVTGDELEQLKSRQDISKITRALEFTTFLQDSKQIVNSTLTGRLQVDGVNLTGRGQTVCIIDSGVNYTHQAFGGCTTEQFLAGNCSKIIGGYAYYNPVNVSNNNTIMGDNDHGTHVAGIVSGIAPDSKIVAMKACGPTPSCDGAAVVDSINWCVINSQAYNISVISMSLGSAQLFNYVCDGLDSDFDTAIAAAVAKNISVIAATGNDYNNTHIALPACLSNVTAVSATNKDDTIASYSNRNFMVSLLATGDSINSSFLNGNYASMSGTSMAAPHVSGAIAIIKQLLFSINSVKSPSQIENILNSTGKNVTDVTGLNYSRINIYNAVLSLDSIKPEINVVSPLNEVVIVNESLTFSANISDWELTNLTFILRNSSGIVLNESINNITGKFNESSISIYNLSNGTYNFSFIGTDSKLNIATVNRTLIVASSNITLVSPQSSYSLTSSSANIIFNFSVFNNFTNCSLIINNNAVKTFDVIDYTLSQNVSNTLTPGSYNWAINCSYQNLTETSNEIRSIIISAPAQPTTTVRSSGGGGGGGGGATTFAVSNEEITTGYVKELKVQQAIQFSVFDANSGKHSLTVNSIGKDYVNITIRSDPIKLTLGIGQSAKLNLSSPNFYDLYVELESIIDGRAKIKIQTINEPKPIFPERTNYTGNMTFITSEENSEKEIQTTNESNTIFYVGLILLVISLTALVTHFIDMKHRKHVRYFGNHKI